MRLLAVLSLLATTVPVAAQSSSQVVRARSHYAPAADEARNIARRSLPSRRAALGQLDPHRLKAFSAAEIQPIDTKQGTLRTGQHRSVEAAALRRGRWDTLPDGSRVWRLAIHSPGALSMRLHFSRFHTGSGQVWVHDGSGEEGQIGGPYAGAGIFGDGDFWSESISSDTVIVEYQPGDSSRMDPPFRIDEISHIYYEPKVTNARDAAAKCNLDVNCFAEWAETAKAVARISFETGGGSFVCSGTLLNTRNNSGDLLFLTANHCIDTDTVARTVQAIWNFQTASCNGAAPSTRGLPTSLGARLLVTGDRTQGDFALIRLNSVPSGVTFSGWDPAEVAVGTALTVVHHPAGDYKRIAFGNRVASSRTGDGYYSVFYSSGLTEGGSSGSGLFSSQLVLVGTLSNGPKADTPEEYCRLIPFADNYGRFSFFFPQLRDILEGRGVGTTPTTPTAPATGGTLTSGTPRPFSIPAVANPTLVNGTRGFTIEVPAGATNLDVRLSSTTSGADLDLYVRYGQDVALNSGSVVADFRSENAASDESVSVTATSSPALRAGTYFIAVGVFTTNTAITASITATVTMPAVPPPGGGGIALTSGVTRPFTLTAVNNPILINGTRGFTIVVPQGATRLDVRLSSTTPNVDLDLYVRFGQDVALSAGNLVTDFKSDGTTADESISITPLSSPALRAGTYFIAFGVYTTGTVINASVTATVTGGSTTPPTGTPTVLTSGGSRNFAIASVTNPSLINGMRGFTIEVPQGASRLDVRVSSSTPNADLDLYVRFGTDVALNNGTVVTDYKSEGDTADELISITPTSTPALRAGTYFIAFGVFSTGININATVTATVTTGSTPPPSGVTPLVSGRAQSFTTPSVTNGTLLNGARSYTIAVPQGATRLDIVLTTTTPNVDIDLYARFGTDTTVASGAVVADHKSEGATANERITIDLTSNPALRAGTYFISLAMFTPNVIAAGTLTATVVTASTPPPATGPTVLTSGVRQNFAFPASTQAVLQNGTRSFVIDVPANATRLDIQLVTTTQGADLDMFAKFGADVTVSGGNAVADYSSAGPGGNERITITPSSDPALRAGRYFIALAVFTTNLDVSGTVLATVTTSAAPPSTPTSPVTLTPGTPAKFALPAVESPTLYNGNFSFKVQVPEGATQMRIQLTSDNPAVDVDLYARYQSDTEVADGAAVADYFSEGPTGNEAITITSASSPPLRAGVYFISLGLFTKGAPATGSIVVTVERGSVAPPTSSARDLVSGTPATYALPAVDSPTLFSGAAAYRVTVGPQHTRLAVSVRNNPVTTDVDLYLRFGQETTVTDGRVVADFRSTNDGGNEDLSVSGASLRPGVYFISLALFSTGLPATGTVTATLFTDGGVAEEVKLTRESGGAALEPKDAAFLYVPIASKDALSKRAEADEEGMLNKGAIKKRQAIEKVIQ